ncbi:MAG: flagellar basal body L-ring protein FlgH [Thermodesulfobacteriota bacterium]|nr:flagellar basal body L-ring protein FlgH [Thermodesulfobacteriota bacterium]
MLTKCTSRSICSLFLIVLFATIISCAGSAKQTQSIVEEYNYDHSPSEDRKKYEASLWTEESGHSILFMDYKARRVNDTITISIVEVSSASGEADTAVGSESSVSAGITSFLGAPSDYGMPNFWGRQNAFNPSIGASKSNTFEGTGKTARKGNLTASITARVIKVLPNGNLVIKGRKEVTINDDEQIITISGIVRPRDISADNTVLSTYIGDARIEYTGKGVLNDKQTPGWLSRLLDWIWPF